MDQREDIDRQPFYVKSYATIEIKQKKRHETWTLIQLMKNDKPWPLFFMFLFLVKKNIRWKITSTPNRQNKFNMPPDQKSLLNRLQ